ncbi:MAG: SLC45 family MFS transporter [Prevotella sp.]|nr:SLC45 family MFS transporter [Prevotella sp.]
MKQKPNLSFWKLWNLSFGFFGVQIAYALQSANISRIFSSMGADPKSLGFFWILPPLMGMIVQPLVGVYSDRTWTRFGRRIPYLIAGAVIAVLVMCLLPNAGNLSNTFWLAMTLGAIILMFLDTSLNMAMQPFKMLVGDMVNEEQKKLGYSIQSFLVNAGQVVGSVLPYLMTALLAYIGISDAGEGVPKSLIYSFYVGAVILILCVFYTTSKVKEWPPKEYAEYHGLQEGQEKERVSMLELLRQAPANYWRVAVVQFFCWAAFLFMWNYSNGALADTCWHTTDTASVDYKVGAGDWVGVVFAIESLAGVLWAMVLSKIQGKKLAYSLSLMLGAVGFLLIPFIHDKFMMFLPYALIGCAWAAMLAMPFTIVTNALEGRPHMGTYLGLFNCTICLPQIIAGLTGGLILSLIGGVQTSMMCVAGVLLVIGAACVYRIKD